MQPETKKPTGISTRVNWKAELVDIKALCKAVADGTWPVNLVAANMPALNQMARAAKNNLNIPGVRAISEQVVSRRI